MQQMQQMAKSGNKMSLMDRGATVASGPLAEEQVALVEFLTIARQMIWDKELKKVLGPKQIKAMEKIQKKASEAKDPAAQQKLMQEMNKIRQEISPEQQQKAMGLMTHSSQLVNQVMLKEQEENWLSNLAPEQSEVWKTIMKCAEDINPEERQKFMRDGQIKIGKMLSEEQKLTMATKMREIRLRHMASLKEEEGTNAKDDAVSNTMRSATEGPIAEAEEKIRLNAERVVYYVKEDCFKSCLNSKQRKYYEKQKAKAEAAGSAEEKGKMVEKLHTKMQGDLTDEQKLKAQAAMKETMPALEERLKKEYQEAWEYSLNAEQGEAWAAEAAKAADAAALMAARQQMTKAMSTEQQNEMGAALAAFAAKLNDEAEAMVKGKQEEKDRELEAANAMLASMGV